MAKNEDPKLASFKIGDLRRPEVRGGGAEEPDPETESVGFPAIESRLENGDIESVAEELRPSYEALEELADHGEMRKKGAAQRAMASYERTADLFEYLFDTKAALQSSE